MTFDASASDFYRAFEDRHRGSRSLIKERLGVYLPFMTAVAELHPALAVLDVGCGRGEWLELLADHHIAAQGVDTDEGMLAACRERGLNVVSGEAIAYLKSLPSESLLAVTGFHVAEHLPFDGLQALFVQARRVIAPGGLLILETPNPENLLVGAANFYIDPTHQRPLPSQLLAFLAEFHGFAPTSLMRLQEEKRLAENGPASLYDVLGNVSPDYAVVAQVPHSASQFGVQGDHLLAQLRQAFEREGGLSLYAMAGRFDAQAQRQASEQQSLADAAQRKAEEAMGQVTQVHTKLQFLDADVSQTKIDVAQTKADVQLLETGIQQISCSLQQLGDHAGQLESELRSVYASRSWRTTRPLRWLARFFRNGSGKP